MKTLVNKKDLIDELTIAKKVAGKKSNLAITQNAVITLKYNSVIIQTTDLESYRLGVVGDNPYRLYDAPCSFPQTLVPVSAFMKALKAIPKKEKSVIIEITKHGAVVLNDKITLAGSGYEVKDFPELPRFPHTNFINRGLECPDPRGCQIFDQIILRNSLNSGRVASDERRSHIIGLLLDFEYGKVTGTDDNRLHISNMLINQNGNQYDPPYDANVIIPRTFASLLLCPQLKNNIGNVTINGQYVFVETGSNGYICSRIIEGEFMDYEDRFPERQFENVLSVKDKKYFMEIMGEAMAITNQDYRSVMFSMGQSLIINSVNPDVGEYRFEIKDKTLYEYLGEEIETAFNPVMIMDAVNCIEEKGVNMYFKNEEYPVWIQSNDQNFNAYIMPMRV